jgi:hypothetical protein
VPEIKLKIKLTIQLTITLIEEIYKFTTLKRVNGSVCCSGFFFWNSQGKLF